MEKIIRKQLLAYVIENNVIHCNQYGFLPGKSTQYQLLILLNDWENNIDAGQTIHTIHLDFDKAFDWVPITDHLLNLKLLA